MDCHLWQDHSPWSVLLTLQHLPPLPQQQQQLLGRLWPLLVPRFLFQLPPQLRSLLLGLPVPLLGVLFTQHGKQPVLLPKELGLILPKRPQKERARKAVAGRGGKRGKEPAAAAVGSYLSYRDQDVGNPIPPFTPTREPGLHLGVPNLRNTLVRPLNFFQLYFTPGLVDDIVEHTNTYAYIEIAKENYTNVPIRNPMGAGVTQPLIRSLGL